jgi:hypothetical protein
LLPVLADRRILALVNSMIRSAFDRDDALATPPVVNRRPATNQPSSQLHRRDS